MLQWREIGRGVHTQTMLCALVFLIFFYFSYVYTMGVRQLCTSCRCHFPEPKKKKSPHRSASSWAYPDYKWCLASDGQGLPSQHGG